MHVVRCFDEAYVNVLLVQFIDDEAVEVSSDVTESESVIDLCSSSSAEHENVSSDRGSDCDDSG